MSVMAETHQSAIGPYVAMVAVGLELYAWTAVIKEALVVKVPGGDDGGEGGGGGGSGGGGEVGGGSEGGGLSGHVPHSACSFETSLQRPTGQEHTPQVNSQSSP